MMAVFQVQMAASTVVSRPRGHVMRMRTCSRPAVNAAMVLCSVLKSVTTPTMFLGMDAPSVASTPTHFVLASLRVALCAVMVFSNFLKPVTMETVRQVTDVAWIVLLKLVGHASIWRIFHQGASDVETVFCREMRTAMMATQSTATAVQKTVGLRRDGLVGFQGADLCALRVATGW